MTWTVAQTKARSLTLHHYNRPEMFRWKWMRMCRLYIEPEVEDEPNKHVSSLIEYECHMFEL